VSVLTVSLGEDSYDILIDSGILSSLGQRCADIGLTGRVAMITNPTVAALYGDCVRRSLVDAGNAVHLIEIPDGEEYKNGTTLNSVYDGLIEAGLDRNSFIVALGGGVVGDLAGFAAATYLRGIPFVQVPTTLLAQVDSSVGGKTAIDHPRGKNLIGAFYQPRLVLIDVATLDTLPEREFRAGLAEVVKYGIALDSTFFAYLEQHAASVLAMDRESLIQVILSCCRLKAGVVELDEKETGVRAVLNYGHTLGHALETLAGYRQLVHGEAVAIGMGLAAHVSMALGHCSEADVVRVIDLFKRLGLQLDPPTVERHLLLDALSKDKKSRSGTLNFICNQDIGSYYVEKISPEQLLSLSGLEVSPGQGAAFPPLDEEPAIAGSWHAGVPVADTMDADFAAFEDEIGEPEEIIEDLEILELDEADLLEMEETDAEPLAAGEPDHDPLSTATLAELYAQQGFTDKALEVYRAILAHDPDNTGVRSRIALLEAGLTVNLAAASAGSTGADAIQERTCEGPSPAASSPPQEKEAEALAILDGWLDNIGRLKACR
jgi:3-dehydroquinate synthase